MRIAPPALVLLALSLHPACVIDELREDEVGDAAWCDSARRWPTESAELEDELFAALNAVRVRSGRCGGVDQDPAGAVQWSPELRCAARRHATFLAQRNATGHEGSGGSMPWQRVGFAEYEGFVMHELIARDFVDPDDVIQAWLDNPEHCRPFYRRPIEHVGIGHSRSANGDRTAWVVLTGRNR